MRSVTRSTLVGAGLAVAVAASANAGLVEVINLGDFVAAGGQSAIIAYENGSNSLDIVGFTLTLNYDTSGDTFAWGSDLRLEFLGLGFSIGGFSTDSDADWDFNGSGSSPSGPYAQLSTAAIWAGSPFSKADLTGFKLTNDFGFNGTVAWNDIVLTLYKIPAPGALALLGFAGALGARRRRA